MSQFIRKAIFPYIDKVPKQTNVGLWLDRYYYDNIEEKREKQKNKKSSSNQEEEKNKKAQIKFKHLEKVLQFQSPEGYHEYFEQRKKLLERLPETTLIELKVEGRLALGLGITSVWENGVSLHHTWGIPLIHGSSLKGLAASFAHKNIQSSEWKRRKATEDSGGGQNHNILFGTNDNQGIVIFHDALWQPESNNIGLDLDIMTVHHQDYYQTNNAEPKETDSPNPVPFLTIHGTFITAITGPKVWRTVAIEILKKALEEEGIGAKTAKGYGRMKLIAHLSPFEKIETEIEQFTFPDDLGQMNKVDSFLLSLFKRADSLSSNLVVELLQLFFKKALASEDKKKRARLRSYFDKMSARWKTSEEKILLEQASQQVLAPLSNNKEAQSQATLSSGEQEKIKQLREAKDTSLLKTICQEIYEKRTFSKPFVQEVLKIAQKKLNIKKAKRNKKANDNKQLINNCKKFLKE